MSEPDSIAVDRRHALLTGAGVLAAASIAPSTGNAMTAELTADDVRSLLQLEPNATCGFVRVTFSSSRAVAPGGLDAPFSAGGPLGSALYFHGVTPVAPGEAPPHQERSALPSTLSW